MNRPDFSEAEKQLLIAVKQIIINDGTPSHENLEKFGKSFFSDDLVDWTDAFASLAKEGLLREDNNAFSLSKQSQEYAKDLARESFNKGFSEHLIQCEQSQTYAVFCERVFGKNLCQCNMMDVEQLQMLLDVLNLSGGNRVLELGCGIGVITEYISDLTGAYIIGIDLAEGAIKRAQERTTEKRDRLVFQAGDMNEIDSLEDSFDTIIAIDTLYFVDDLEHTVAQMKTVMRPGGQMGIFYSEMIKPEQSQDVLLPDNTKLAQALTKLNLSFRTYDYTAKERGYWTMCKQVAEELRPEFEAEGNLEICKCRVEESERVLEVVNSDRNSRHLYHVRQGSF